MALTGNTLNIVIGQGLAGSAIAWRLHWQGESVLLLDAANPNSASRVAAGLITPITGKRLVKSPEYEEEWKTAIEFYRRVEQETGPQFFREQSMLRVFADVQSRSDFQQRSGMSAEVVIRECRLQSDGRQHSAIELCPAGRLDVTAYLSATRAFFESKGWYRQEEVDTDRPKELLANIEKRDDVTSDHRLIMATGARVSKFFPEVPNNPSQGEILQVSIPEYVQPLIVHRSIWIAPEANGRQTVGSTYNWKQTDGQPSKAGRDEIRQKLTRLVDGQITVHEHTAGVRPTMKDYEPVVGRHPDYPDVFVMNGLGSKGVLRAPTLAADLISLMKGKQISPRRDYLRLLAKASHKQPPLTTIAQQKIRSILKPGDLAVDATVGNGFDTCFLAEVVGITGGVIGFDIQQSAIDATEIRLKANNLQNVNLHHMSHERITEFVQPRSVAAVMFNLGYLPRSDHSITTTAESTLTAIKGAMKVLQPAGILTVLCYRGHDGGLEEFEAVNQLLSASASRYDLERIDSSPPKNTSPVLFVVRHTQDPD